MTWLELPNPDGSGDPKSRLPFVATNDRSTGYDVWAGIGNLVRGTCSTPVTPPAPTTARCTAWSDTFTDAQNDQQKIVHNAHGDSGTIVFDPSASVDACPTLYSSDGGVYRNTLITSPECHAPIFAAENAGLHAFMLWGMAEVHRPGVESEDLYIALQDNGLYSTADAGTNAPTWTHGLGADVGDVVADTTTVVAWTGDLLVGDPGFTNVEKVLPKFPGGSLAQVIVEASPGHYMMVIIRPFDLDPPQGTQIPIGVRETTDIKADPVGTLLGNWPPAAKVPCHIQVGLGATGPQPYVLAGTCALGRTDKGADELWTYRDGLWTQIAPPPLKHGGTVSAEAGFGLIAVDPAHATRLYASVLYDGPPRMMR